MQAKLASHNETRKSHRLQAAELQRAIEAEKSTRSESVSTLHNRCKISCFSNVPGQEQRARSISRLATLEEELRELGKELNAYGDSDPTRFAEAKRAVLLGKEAALRWTGKRTAG